MKIFNNRDKIYIMHSGGQFPASEQSDKKGFVNSCWDDVEALKCYAGKAGGSSNKKTKQKTKEATSQRKLVKARIVVNDDYYIVVTAKGVNNNLDASMQKQQATVNKRILYSCTVYHSDGTRATTEEANGVYPLVNAGFDENGLLIGLVDYGDNGIELLHEGKLEPLLYYDPAQEIMASPEAIQTLDDINSRENKARTEFDEQIQSQGFAGDFADFVKSIFGSDNTEEKVRNDLEVSDSQIKELEEALKQGELAFKSKFQEIFGKAFNADNIQKFKEIETIYEKACQAKAQEDYFKNTHNLLLSGKPLSGEKGQRDSNGEYFYGVSEEQVYKREFNKLAKTIGKDGVKTLNQLIKQSVGENASLDNKYKVLQSFARLTADSLSQNTINCGGGRSFEEMTKLYDTTYEQAFGENNILKRVREYNESQQKGAGVVKMVTVTAATIAAGFISGGIAVPIVAGVATGGVEVADKITSGYALDAFNKGGIKAWLEKTNELTDWNSVAMASASAAGMTVMFMGQSMVVTNLMLQSGKTVTQAMLADIAAGTVSGAGVEYAMTGEISVEGQIFSVALSLVGGAIAVKSIKKGSAKPQIGLDERSDVKNVNIPTNPKIQTTQTQQKSKPQPVQNINTPSPSKTKVKSEPPRPAKVELEELPKTVMPPKPPKAKLEPLPDVSVETRIPTKSEPPRPAKAELEQLPEITKPPKPQKAELEPLPDIIVETRIPRRAMPPRPAKVELEQPGIPAATNKTQISKIEPLEIPGVETTAYNSETLNELRASGNKHYNETVLAEYKKVIQTAEDEQVFKLLVNQKDKSGKPVFNCDEILKIMKSNNAKNFVLQHNTIQRSDINAIDESILTQKTSYQLSSTRDLSYQIKDIDESFADVQARFMQNKEQFAKEVTPPGEVLNIQGKLYCNTGDELVPVNLSKEKFEELFPIEQRHNIKQGTLGDCYLVADISALMDTPKGRAAIYQCFHQEGNDVYITLQDRNPVKFVDGKPYKLSPFKFYRREDNGRLNIGLGSDCLKGSNGVKMLEQSFAISKIPNYTSDTPVENINKIMRDYLEGGFDGEASRHILPKENVEHIYSYLEEDYLTNIQQNIGDDNTQILFSTKEGADKKNNLGLYTAHSHNIVGYDANTGTISIVDPHNCNEVIQLPVYEWLNCVDKVIITKLK